MTLLQRLSGSTLRVLKPVLPVPGGLKSFDLFALTVVVMIIGHIGYYFMPDEPGLRIADRMLVPVFLVSVGYNAGRRPSPVLWGGAIIMTVLNWVHTHHFYVDVLGVIVLMRFIIDPFMGFVLRNKIIFWVVNALLVFAYPFTDIWDEYGSIALVMAMAGWINRNRGEVPAAIVKPAEYFAFAWLTFLYCTQTTFQFSVWQIGIIGAGMGFTMYLLYNFRQLLLNGIAAKRRDPVEKICHFLGHKSLEIYLFHAIAYQLILAWAVGGF